MIDITSGCISFSTGEFIFIFKFEFDLICKLADEDEGDSYSRMPPNFPLPLPAIRLEMPTRMHLTELDVDRLNVREVYVDHLIVSAMDTANLQVFKLIKFK